MKNLWGEDCQSALLRARNESMRLEHGFLGTEHLVLALLMDPASLLSQVLRQLRILPPDLEEQVRNEISPSSVVPMEGFTLSRRVRAIVRQAEQLVTERGGGAIDEAHLLEAIFAGGRGVAMRALENLDILPEDLLRALDTLRPPLLAPHHALAPPPTHLPLGHSTLPTGRVGGAAEAIESAERSLLDAPVAPADDLAGLSTGSSVPASEAATLPGRLVPSAEPLSPTPSPAPPAPAAARPGDLHEAATLPGRLGGGPGSPAQRPSAGEPVASPPSPAPPFPAPRSSAARSPAPLDAATQAGQEARRPAFSAFTPAPSSHSERPDAHATRLGRPLERTVDADAVRTPPSPATASPAPAGPSPFDPSGSAAAGSTRAEQRAPGTRPSAPQSMRLAKGQPLYDVHPVFFSSTPKARGTSFGISQLAALGRDLTALASSGQLGPIIGRDSEIESIVRTLCRERRSNVLLVGESGVGKTSTVEGLAIDIVSGRVPAPLRGVRLLEIGAQALVGALQPAHLEAQVHALLREAVMARIVLVIDELDLLCEAPSGGGKTLPTILGQTLAARGVHVLGIVTPAGSGAVERTPQLYRSFEPVKITEPDEASTLEILRVAQERLAAFHQVEISEEALLSTYSLVGRYLKAARQPISSIDLLDQACVLSLRLVGPHSLPHVDEASSLPRVEAAAVAQAVSLRTGVPLHELTSTERARLGDLESELARHIVGQDEAVHRVAERIRMVRAGLCDEQRPLGVFLFMGPTGVGKTELARALATYLFPALPNDERLLRLDMSEYASPVDMNKLIGAPPAYVGYERDGLLTAHLRKTGHFVLLLDEIEKACPSVLDLFLQVFDAGRVTDSHGSQLDFRQAIIIMTSNLGAHLHREHVSSPAHLEDPPREDGPAGSMPPVEAIRDELRRHLRLELINRIDDIVTFQPLGRAQIQAIARQVIDRWQGKAARQGYRFTYGQDLLDLVCAHGYDPELGARPMRRAVEQLLIGPLSREILAERVRRGGSVRVTAQGGEVRFVEEDSPGTA